MSRVYGAMKRKPRRKRRKRSAVCKRSMPSEESNYSVVSDPLPLHRRNPPRRNQKRKIAPTT
jgi:hypothetical protein